MALTREEITAGATYTVRIDRHELSVKRFNDAVKLVKGLNERPETTARYDGATRSWAVTLPADSVGGVNDVQVLAYIYNATVEIATGPQAPAAQAPRKAAAPRQQMSGWGRTMGLAEREDGDGYTRSERDAMGH